MKMKECKHEWYVISKTHEERSLIVECRKCRAFGIVENPTKEEWNEASNTEEPYLWKDNSRAFTWP